MRAARAQRLAVGLERLERRGGRHFHLGVIAFDRRQRLAELLAEQRRRGAELAQHVLLALRLHLTLRQGIAGDAVLGAQGDDVAAAQRGDGAGEQGPRANPLADVASDLVGDGLHRIALHHAQRGLDALVRHHVQERRLAQLHRQGLAERVVEHRVAGAVGERRQHDQVARLRAPACAWIARRAPRPPPPPWRPAPPATTSGRGRGPAATPRDEVDAGHLLGVALQPLQLGAQVGGRLVAVRRVLLERPGHDPIEVVGQARRVRPTAAPASW